MHSEVSEGDAAGEVSDVYADIRSTMGVAVVNLIWRRLAVEPPALVCAWRALRPHYASGAIPRAGWMLRQQVVVPEIEPLTLDDVRAADVAPDELATVDAMLRTYERGNAQNLVALCALRNRLDPEWPSAELEGNAAGAASATSPSSAEEQLDRITESLPPLPALDGLSAPVLAKVRRISATWVPPAQRQLTPTVFRHLAHWPGLLDSFCLRLESISAAKSEADDPIGHHADAAIASATLQGRQLGLEAGPLNKDLRPTETAWIERSIALFIDAMIGRGVVIVPAMRRALPLR